MRNYICRGKKVGTNEFVYGGFVKRLVEKTENSFQVFAAIVQGDGTEEPVLQASVGLCTCVRDGTRFEDLPKKRQEMYNVLSFRERRTFNNTEVKTGADLYDGEDIYEGDIVRFRGELYEVVFEDRNGSAYFGMKVSPEETIPFGEYSAEERPVIVGNIYDDPELTGDSDQKRRYRRVLELMEAQQRSEAEE